MTVAEWLRRWIVAPTTRVQFSPVTPFQKGVRLVERRQSLKLASGVRFGHRIARALPLAAGGAPSGPGGAPRSERGGSRFEAWAASQFLRVSFKGQDRTLRTFRLGFDSSYPYQIFGRSSNRTGRSAPNAEIGVGIPTGQPVSAV